MILETVIPATSDLRTENLITYTPNKAVTPIVTYGDALTDRSSVADTAALLEEVVMELARVMNHLQGA